MSSNNDLVTTRDVLIQTSQELLTCGFTTTGSYFNEVANEVSAKSATLRAKAPLDDEDVDFVKVGQTVKLKVGAYLLHKYGLRECGVVQINADAIKQVVAARR